MLQNEIKQRVEELQSYVRRNQKALESQTGHILNFEDADEVAGSPGWPSLDLKVADGTTPTDAAQAAMQQRSTVRSSSVPPETAPRSPYHMQQGDDAHGASTSSGSGGLTTPEFENHVCEGSTLGWVGGE